MCAADSDGDAIDVVGNVQVFEFAVFGCEGVEIKWGKQIASGQHTARHFFLWIHQILPTLRSQASTLVASAAEPARAAILDLSCASSCSREVPRFLAANTKESTDGVVAQI
ncbi:Uncharacterized membrane protein YbhN [Pseudomonas syringae pv. actinidiae]|uniref:Uncharacterized membrane protein YbhN n=1 Tax=Pseudomonas syringae pv. actinidiae TaxID=103796 RepID=A0AAN4PZR9_PSESF|nr:Uncharacterized membrane protein YbhN [Pseudomonas syringae pv. actinidiae]